MVRALLSFLFFSSGVIDATHVDSVAVAFVLVHLLWVHRQSNIVCFLPSTGFWYLFVDSLMAHQRRLHSVKHPDGGDEELTVQPDAESRWKGAQVSESTFRTALVQLYTCIKNTTMDEKKVLKMEEKLRQVDVVMDKYQNKFPSTWQTVICKLVKKLHGICPSVYFVQHSHGDGAEDDDRAFLEGRNDYGNSHPHTENDYGTPDSGVKLFRNASNKVVRCSQMHCYAHRGPYLEMMTPWEYVATVQLVERRSTGDQCEHKQQEEHPLFFAALANGECHVLAETHMQKLRVKCLVPILAGKKTPPPFPGPQPGDCTSDAYYKWLNKAGAAAQYYGALFLPHCIKTGKAPCQGADKRAAWDQLCTILQTLHEATAETRHDHKILNARFATIFNIAHCQRSSMNANMLSRSHRSRFADSLKHIKGKTEDGSDTNAATQAYMDELIATMQGGQDPALEKQEKDLFSLFGDHKVEAQNGTTDHVEVGRFLSHNSLSIKQATANFEGWKKLGRDHADLPVSSEGGSGSASSRYTTKTVATAVAKFLSYVVSKGMEHNFKSSDLNTDVLETTVQRLVQHARNNKDQWLETCECWQDAVVDQLKKMLVNQDQDHVEDMVHGFLEALSLDQLQPYMDAIATVRNGKPLRLIIHAPPGCGKT
tara:strand:- start:2797 stop:4752 length:1956 start_codon:yes stop_codon:yes gene_type:complete